MNMIASRRRLQKSMLVSALSHGAARHPLPCDRRTYRYPILISAFAGARRAPTPGLLRLQRRLLPTKPVRAAHGGYESTRSQLSHPPRTHALTAGVRPSRLLANPQKYGKTHSRGARSRQGWSASWWTRLGIQALCAWGATTHIFAVVKSHMPALECDCAARRAFSTV